MKKYLWTFSVVALFAIGFAASDDEKSSSSSSNSSSQTEQKQDEMKNELLDYARKKANGIATYSHPAVKGQPISRDVRDEQCKTAFLDYLRQYSSSTTDDNMQLYEEFKKAWDEEYDKVEAAKRAMDNF